MAVERFAVLREAVRIFNRNGCFTSAAAISYYAFFSIIPLMFIVTAGVGFLIGSRPDLQDRVVGMVRSSLPYLSDRFALELKDLTAGWKTFGWLGLIGLVSSAELVMSAITKALTAVFETSERFGFFRTKAVSFLALLAAILTAVGSVAITAASYYFAGLEVGHAGLEFVYSLVVIALFRYLAPFLLVALAVTFAYRAMSGPNLDLRHAFFGSLLFTVLWEAAKQLFALYVANYQSYNKFYGSLGTLMVLLLWIFYSANIFLFSASVARASYLAARPRRRRHR